MEFPHTAEIPDRHYWAQRDRNMSAADALPFDFLQLLGQGAQGSVHVVYNREHAEYQAVKLIAADYVTGHKKVSNCAFTVN